MGQLEIQCLSWYLPKEVSSSYLFYCCDELTLLLREYFTRDYVIMSSVWMLLILVLVL